MTVKDIIYEDFINYKKPSMFIIFPTCSFKCDIENHGNYCQNSSLNQLPNKEISIDEVVRNYINNPITSSIVCGGLEPFDSWDDLKELIVELRKVTNDDIIIYTGYEESELFYKIAFLKQFSSIIIKFGRFIPNQSPHFDKLLGINLSSSNQYAKQLS